MPLTLETVQPQLAAGHGIAIRALPSAANVAVGEAAAVATAVEHFGPAAGVSAFAVPATATNYGKVQPDGTLELLIGDRPVWLVLMPNMEVHPSGGPRGRPHPPSSPVTLAVLIDADTGDFLMAATV